MNNCWLDCEFIDRGSASIELLSIGIVRGDHATYYAEPREARLTGCSEFVLKHVLPVLHTADGLSKAPRDIVKPRHQIANEIVDFVGPSPIWWAYYDHYDWVALSGLYGTLVDRPAGWPMRCRDVAELATLAGMGDGEGWIVPENAIAEQHGLLLPEGAHHALAGAWWCQALHAVAVERLEGRGMKVL